jgi:hypothetical protein
MVLIKEPLDVFSLAMRNEPIILAGKQLPLGEK